MGKRAATMRPLRLLVYDRTCIRPVSPSAGAPRSGERGLGLSTVWSVGSALYLGLRRIDAALGVSSWDEALAWLATYEPARRIAEVQYWGHGQWGRDLVGNDPLDAGA